MRVAGEDFFTRQLEGLIRVYAKLLFGKEYRPKQQQEPVSLQDDLERMLHQGELGEAEDLLFEVLERAVAEGVGRWECQELVNWFYEQLSQMCDEELEHGNFSREEIIQGQAQALFLCVQSAD